MYLNFQINFQIPLGLRKSNICVPTTFYVIELILSQFSPFDIKYKKINLMRKTSWNIFLGYLGEFSYFPSVGLDYGGAPWVMLQYSVQALCNNEDGALCGTKIGNSQKLLLTVSIKSFRLKCDRAFCDLVLFVQFKKREKPATLLKLTLFHGCFSRFLNCTNSTKSRNPTQM